MCIIVIENLSRTYASPDSKTVDSRSRAAIAWLCTPTRTIGSYNDYRLTAANGFIINTREILSIA